MTSEIARPRPVGAILHSALFYDVTVWHAGALPLSG